MKKVLLFIFVLISYRGYSQKPSNANLVDKPKFSAQDSVITDAEHQTVCLYGNVNFEIGKLKLNADKVFFDRKVNQVTATGLKEYSFTEKVNASSTTKNKILRYTVGDDTVFIE